MLHKLTLLTFLLLFTSVSAQQAYYDDVNLNLTGEDLYLELQQKISVSNANFTYGDIRDTVKITDEDPSNFNNLLLAYGYNDGDGNCTTDRSRDKDDFGGLVCEYNREHVFARGNANPPMGNADNSTIGIAADPHNVRPADQQMNNNKGNKKLASGSGNAGNVGSGNWYPGDEWKGDVARMMMYMFTRYGDRCLPSLNGTGPLQGSTDMLQLFLQWNVDDPVSDFEDQRNPHLEGVYGNRNPFIDNPYLATIIWGGPAAEDRWNFFSIEDNNNNLAVKFEPNPARDYIYLRTGMTIDYYEIYGNFGNVIYRDTFEEPLQKIDVSGLSSGLYFFKFTSGNKSSVQKIIIQ